ncbi:MAG: arylsulfatase B [Pseudomonadales bacterium]
MKGKGIFWCQLLALLYLLPALVVTAADSRPNVVILLADDLGWSDVGFHGSNIETPGIDRIASEGVQLNRFYSTPICTPTRAALLTGRDPLPLGMAYSVLMPWDNFGVDFSEHFMSESFRAAGYDTAMIGKWHLGHTVPEHHPNANGFDYFFGHLHTAPDYFTHKIQHGIDLQRNGETVNRTGEYVTFVDGEATVDWLVNRRDKNKPFFLYVPFVAPHNPMQAPQDLIDKYKHIPAEPSNPQDRPMYRRINAAMIDALDQTIVDILNALDSEGVANNTIVLFFSDNGGSSANGSSNKPLRGWKGQTFEGGIRVVAAMRWPKTLRAGKVNNQVMTAMDVFPTLAAATGVKMGNTKAIDGQNVWPNIRRNKATKRKDDIFFSSEISTAGLFHNTVINGDWKLVQVVDQLLETTTVKNMLFNLADDPNEKIDLAAKHPERVQDFAQRIHNWRTQHPIAGTRTRLVPPPGWRPALDWAAAMRAAGPHVNKTLKHADMGMGVEALGPELMQMLDEYYGERGRLLYK